MFHSISFNLGAKISLTWENIVLLELINRQLLRIKI
jgi:hypothetical protein